MRELHDHNKEQQVLKMFSRHLLMDIFFEVRAPVLQIHPFISDLSNEFPRVVFSLCSDAVQPVFCQEEEVIFEAGDACTSETSNV